MGPIEEDRDRPEGDGPPGGDLADTVGMLSHELRGPVATIKGLAATTAQHYERLSDDERLESLRMIGAEADRMLAVVEQVSLAFDAERRGGRSRRRIALADVVREAIDGATAPGRRVELELADGLEVSADGSALTEAVRQLVTNADRFSPPELPIGVATAGGRGHATIEVLDRGPGIPDERRGEVFTRFVRWRPPGYEDRQGPGLGLWIARHLVEAQGGRIGIEPRPGGGTILRIRLVLEA
jgi:signal transduction histidine kinase